MPVALRACEHIVDQKPGPFRDLTRYGEGVVGERDKEVDEEKERRENRTDGESCLLIDVKANM